MAAPPRGSGRSLGPGALSDSGAQSSEEGFAGPAFTATHGADRLDRCVPAGCKYLGARATTIAGPFAHEPVLLSSDEHRGPVAAVGDSEGERVIHTEQCRTGRVRPRCKCSGLVKVTSVESAAHTTDRARCSGGRTRRVGGPFKGPPTRRVRALQSSAQADRRSCAQLLSMPDQGSRTRRAGAPG